VVATCSDILSKHIPGYELSISLLEYSKIVKDYPVKYLPILRGRNNCLDYFRRKRHIEITQTLLI
jgi:hypothetical protein